MGEWRDGLFDCFRFGLCHAPLCLTFWCTPIALGQLMTRMNLNFIGSKRNSTTTTTTGTISPFTLMFLLVIVYVAADWILALMIEPYMNAEEEDDETGQIYTADELYMPPWVHKVQIMRQVWQFLYGLFVFVVLLRVRNHVRKRYSIPASTCSSCGVDRLEDCCCAMWCGPCSICQMMRHTSDYRHDEAMCCTRTGLQVAPRTV